MSTNKTEYDLSGQLKMKIQNHFGFFENWKNYFFVLDKFSLLQVNKKKKKFLK